MTKSNSNEWWFSPLFRVAGYGLLALSLLDIVNIFVAPKFEDPVWEFQMIRTLVERAPLPLLGLVLVFCGETSFRIFKFLSWASFVVGVLFLLLVPLGVSSTWRLDQQLSTKLTQQTAQIQQLKDQLSKATTDEQIKQVLTRLNPQSSPLEMNNPQQLKSQLLSKLAQAEKTVEAQAEAKRANRPVLVKDAIKINLGALVSGIVFLSIWGKTRKAQKVSRQRL